MSWGQKAQGMRMALRGRRQRCLQQTMWRRHANTDLGDKSESSCIASMHHKYPYTLGTAPLSNSWIIILMWLYTALNSIPNIDCYFSTQPTPETLTQQPQSSELQIRYATSLRCAKESYRSLYMPLLSLYLSQVRS